GTADNPWTSPSQADDGTIVAVRAKPNLAPIVRMRQNGSVINEIPGVPMQFGPFEPAVSPDGRFGAFQNVYRDTMGVSSDVLLTTADGLTHPSVYGTPGRGAGSPSWIGSDRILVGDWNRVMTMVPGPGAQAVEWWNEWDLESVLGPSEDLDDGELS